MKILYVGGLYKGCTGLSRKVALEQLGHQVIPFDTTNSICRMSKKSNYLTRRIEWGPAIWALNKELRSFLKNYDYDVVWVAKGIWLNRKTVELLKKGNKATVVHYNPDDPFGKLGKTGWQTFLKAIPSYDIHFVRRTVNIQEYKNAGANKVFQVLPNYNPDYHKPWSITLEEKQKLGSKIGFIGDYEEERAGLMNFLAENGLSVRIWGPNWNRNQSLMHPDIKLENKGLYAEEYAKAICAFDINLAFLRKVNRDLCTSRSVEIPACGAFMLAERTTEHQELFEEGREAEFFNSNKELLEKVRYYLKHEDERKKIALAGRQRCINSGYDNVGTMNKCIEYILDNRS